MKVNRNDVEYVLSFYKLVFEIDKQEILVNKILEAYNNSKTLYKMPSKITVLFGEIANYNLNNKLAKKIIYDISCQTQFTELLKDFQECDIIKDKIDFDRNNYTITLTVHENFIVKTDLALQKTYINGKFYYDIEEQDLLECYCDFVTNKIIYVIYKKRRPLSLFDLSPQYIKLLNDKDKVEKMKAKKYVYMIFTNTELIYKSE